MLRGVEEALANFFASGPLALGPKLGPVLWQLPPNLGYHPERIEDFLRLLPRTTTEAAALAEGHTDKVPDPCTETDADRALARRRVRWWALGRTGVPRSREQAALLRKRSAVPWNPSIALADRALGETRLPHVKIDTLRHDPYGLGADRLLARCEEQHPTAFEGVRAHLADTAAAYPTRPGEELQRLPAPVRALRRFVEYGRG